MVCDLSRYPAATWSPPPGQSYVPLARMASRREEFQNSADLRVGGAVNEMQNYMPGRLADSTA